jgi:hypothetical protein
MKQRPRKHGAEVNYVSSYSARVTVILEPWAGGYLAKSIHKMWATRTCTQVWKVIALKNEAFKARRKDERHVLETEHYILGPILGYVPVIADSNGGHHQWSTDRIRISSSTPIRS